MKKMNTLTVNGMSYTIEDARAVSYAEAQTLTEEQKAQARENIGAAKAEKQYELIEDITLTEEVVAVSRKVDTDGNKYNFSAVFLNITTPTSTTSAAVNIFLRKPDGDSLIYHANSGALGTSEKKILLKAYNDHGLVEYYCAVGNTTNTTLLPKNTTSYTTNSWVNVAEIRVNTYKSSTQNVPFPVGTRIRIYAIRG